MYRLRAAGKVCSLGMSIIFKEMQKEEPQKGQREQAEKYQEKLQCYNCQRSRMLF